MGGIMKPVIYDYVYTCDRKYRVYLNKVECSYDTYSLEYIIEKRYWFFGYAYKRIFCLTFNPQSL